MNSLKLVHLWSLTQQIDTLVVEGNDELSDGCDDAVERDNSLENVEDNDTSAVAAVEISSEPSSSRFTTPVSSLGNKGEKRKRAAKGKIVEDLFLK